MDFFGLAEEVEGLERELTATEATGARLGLLVRLAWYLRQRDTRRSLELVAEARGLLAGLSDAAAAGLAAARLDLIRAEADWLFAALDAAEARLGAVREAFLSQGDGIGAGDARMLAALVARDRGDLPGRAEQLAAADADYRAAGDALRLRVAEAWITNDTAFVDPASAEARFAGDEAEPGLHPGLVAVISAYLAPAAFQRSDFRKAALWFQRGFEAAMASGQLRAAIVMGTNVGAAFSNLNDHAAALEWSERMVDLSRRTGWPSIIGVAVIQAATALRAIGRCQAARALLAEGVEALRPLEHSVIFATACQYMGDLSLDLGDHAEALSWFARAERLARLLARDDLVGHDLRGQAHALCRLGQPAAALAAGQAALAIARRDGDGIREIEALRALAEIRRHPGEGAATTGAPQDYLEAALAVAAGIDGYTVPDDLLSEIARDYAGAGDCAKAYEFEVRAGAARQQIHSKQASDRAVALQVHFETERAHAEAEHHRQLATAESHRAQVLLQATETLGLLGTIGQEITANLQTEAVFEALLRHTGELVDTTTLSIYLLDATGETLALSFGRENGRPIQSARVPIDHPTAYTAQCARSREEVVVELDPEAAAVNVIPGTVKTLSLLFAPLVVGDRLLGVLSIQSTKPHAYGDRERSIFRTLCAYGAIALANAAAMTELRQTQTDLLAHVAQLEHLAMIDTLTGAGNRHHFHMRAEVEIERARRHARPLGLVLFDIDHFKQVNDTWGHAVGDLILRGVVETVRSTIRPEDFLARIGGEEFVILLPGADPPASWIAAERLRSAMAAKQVEAAGSTITVTASFGVTAVDSADGKIDRALGRADEALYRAKQRGRNQVCVAEELGREIRFSEAG